MKRPIFSLVLLALGISLQGCGNGGNDHPHRVVIQYWEKWTGIEADSMREIVNDFNASQDRIFVDCLTVSQIDRKVILSIAGGDPPDVAGIWEVDLPNYAENRALLPLDKMAADSGIKAEDYIPVYWEMCRYQGRLWALPTTPGIAALHWNKKMFREAGLDPEHPPASIKELEEMNDKLTRFNPDGSIAQMGHNPLDPGWWTHCWGFWFGARAWNGTDRVTADSPEQLAMFSWIASYPRRFGAQQLINFQEGAGNFASPQNPFFEGREAMVIQGPWFYNFIRRFAPKDFEWGVAAFPSVDPVRLPKVSTVMTDVLVIPVGAAHPKEAFEFIRYVNTRAVLEKMALLMARITPLNEDTPEFFRDHPNPHIKVYIDLAKSPNAIPTPQFTTYDAYSADIKDAVGSVMDQLITPEQAAAGVEKRQQKLFDRKQERWQRSEKETREAWDRL